MHEASETETERGGYYALPSPPPPPPPLPPLCEPAYLRRVVDTKGPGRQDSTKCILCVLVLVFYCLTVDGVIYGMYPTPYLHCVAYLGDFHPVVPVLFPSLVRREGRGGEDGLGFGPLVFPSFASVAVRTVVAGLSRLWRKHNKVRRPSFPLSAFIVVRFAFRAACLIQVERERKGKKKRKKEKRNI